jgi:DNA-binding NarL/FixJ family response regulator
VSTKTVTACRVTLHACDPISYAGIATALASCYDLAIVDDDDAADVAIVVTESIDGHTQQLARQLRRGGTGSVILITATVDDRGLFAAVEAGISGILRRNDATPDNLASAIRDAHNGDGSLPPDLLGRLLKQVTQLHDHLLSPNGMHLSGLTDREISVLKLVADGYATGEIATQLSYSERTIKNVIQDITTRLGLRNRSHAVAYALRQGLI